MKEKGTRSENRKLLEGFLSKSARCLHLDSHRLLVGPLHYSLQGCKEAAQQHLPPQKGPPTLWLRFSRKISNWFYVEAVGVLLPASNLRGKFRIATEMKESIIPGANVIPSSQPECVPHGWTKLCQLAVLLAPEEALSETTVSLPLWERWNNAHKIFSNNRKKMKVHFQLLFNFPGCITKPREGKLPRKCSCCT